MLKFIIFRNKNIENQTALGSVCVCVTHGGCNYLIVSHTYTLHASLKHKALLYKTSTPLPYPRQLTIILNYHLRSIYAQVFMMAQYICVTTLIQDAV